MAEAIVKDGSPKTRVSIDRTTLSDLDLNDEVKASLVYTVDDKEDQEKKQAALKSMKKLLDISERYSEFCNKKLNKILQQSEEERVDNLMNQKEVKQNGLDEIRYFKGTLKDYQVVGVNWMTTLFEHGVNGILADEMGLGKTVQVIALICYLIEKISGPFLIVVPLSTVPNWKSEFKRFAPDIPVVIFHGSKEERSNLMRDVLKIYKMNNETVVRPVVITTIHMVAMELRTFSKISWKYLIMDEGHCLKNHEAQVSHNMRMLKSLNKVILTGTPLQNNLKELWALLNFLMPKIFRNIDTFAPLFILEDFHDNSKIVKEEQTTNVISSLHKILQPFMLRRLKSDVLHDLVPKKEVIVYCPLTILQRTLYMYIIKKNLAGLSGKKEEAKDNTWLYGPRPKRQCVKNKKYVERDDDDSFDEEVVEYDEKVLGEKIDKNAVKYVHSITMQSPLTMFKKVVNHPYLVRMPVTPDGKQLLVDEQLISESGKMLVLEEMLSKLKAQKHKVLIFSTLVIMLDLIEEFMILRNYTYCRLDGRTKLADRERSIATFNSDPNVFAFLVSTRAGGLGLNLTGADTVILYDRDWNPQADIQAQSRCHRIGQTKPVMVYSLITKNTVDDKILTCGNMKKKLEKVIIKGGKFKNPTTSKADMEIDLDDLLEMLEKDDTMIVHKNSDIFSDEEWSNLLDRTELYDEMKRYSKKYSDSDEEKENKL